MSLFASLLTGALLGAANAAAALWLAARAGALEPNRGMQVVLGGMLVRMLVVLALFAAVLATVAVHRGAFVTGLGVTFGLGLLAEVFLVLSRPRSA